MDFLLIAVQAEAILLVDIMFSVHDPQIRCEDRHSVRYNRRLLDCTFLNS